MWLTQLGVSVLSGNETRTSVRRTELASSGTVMIASAFESSHAHGILRQLLERDTPFWYELLFAYVAKVLSNRVCIDQSGRI